MADATLESLSLLDDPQRFRIVAGVPIFKPHVRKDAEGNELYQVRDEHIPEISRRMKDREGSGVVGRLTMGHVKPGKTQAEQPPLVGYWRNPRPGVFGPKSEPCVLVDYAVRNECWDEFRSAPYRSAEFYPNKGIITGVACLKTDPELDLGVLIFENGEKCYHYSMGTKEEGMGTDEASPEHVRAFASCMKRHYPYMDRIHKEHAERYEASGPGIPSSTNAFVPAMSDQKDKKDQPQSLEQMQEQLVTYERELADNKKRIDDLIALDAASKERIRQIEHANQMVTYERELELRHRDFVFDLDEEKKLVSDYTPEQFAKHLTIMQRYEKRPHMVPAVGPNGYITRSDKKRKPTIQEHHQAVALATRNGVSYGQALDEILNPAQ